MVHPEGALLTAKDFRALIVKAKKNAPVKFWIVRSRRPQERFVAVKTTFDGKRGKLRNYLSDKGVPLTYNYQHELRKGCQIPLYAFENYWMAWAYYLRVIKAKEAPND